MSFTPDRSNSGEIEPFKLLQESFSQASPLYLSLVVIATPALVISVLNGQNPLKPSIPLNLIYLFLVSPLVAGTGIYMVYRYLTTQTVDLAGATSSALTKIGSLVLSFFVTLVIVIVGSFAIIPGIFAGVKLGFGLYGVIVDDLGPIASIKQSWNLVTGRWWPTFGSMLLPVILLLPLSLLEGILASVFGGGKAIGLSSIISAAPTLLITPFITIYYVKIYLRLKELAE